MRLRISLFFLFFYSFIFSQQYVSTNYTTANGLPNNAVRSLFIDKENVLWIGTENGVSRFLNGSFYTITQDDGLGYNSCWDIAQDKNGNMWFASYGGGVSKFDGKKFYSFTSKNGLPADKTRKVFHFKNKIYVGTEQGIAIIDINTHKMIIPKVPKTKEDFICIDFFVYKDEVYFVSVFEGLYKIDYSQRVPKVNLVFKNKNNYSTHLVGENLFIGNEGYLQKANIQALLSEKKEFEKLKSSIFWDYAQRNKEILYAAADGVYNPDGGLFQIKGSSICNVSNLFGIDSKILLNVVYDKRNDILYVGSNDKGIYEVRLDKSIQYYPFQEKNIIDIESINTSRFILHNEGISVLNKNNEKICEVNQNNFKAFEIATITKAKRTIATNYRESRDFELNFNIPARGIVFYELVKHNNSIWIGSNLGIFELNERGNIVNYIPKHSLKIGFTIDDKFIETITYGGLYLYDDVYKLQGKHFSKFENATPQFIVKILNNRKKTYLISVFNGLFSYSNGKFTSFLFENIWNEKKFKHITSDAKGNLILAAEFGTVFVVNDQDKFKIIKTIPKKDIVGNSINFLESYKDYILIGTEKGINVYQNGVIRLLDKEHGLNDCNFKTSQLFQDELWLGTLKGYYVLNLAKLLSAQQTVKDIAINGIAINNQPIAKSKYDWFTYANNELICDYKHNSFSIDFVPKGHLFADKLKFRYRLNNGNRWSPYSDKTNVFLSYLPYGAYNLEIEVFDQNTGKISLFKLLKIVIQPPFWLRWWFFVIVLLIVISIVIFIVYNYKRRSRERILIEKRLAETKMEALLSQMNPHFTFNAMNTVQDFIISNDVDNSLLFISELARLMRLTLDNSSQKSIPLNEEIDFLKTYIKLENLRFGNRIQVTITIDEAIDAHFIAVPPMLFQPFIENVFVHAFNEEHPNPTLDISFKLKEKHLLVCQIKDNGKGKASFEKVKLHKSKALLLAEERLRLIQPQILNPITTNFTEFDGTSIVILLQI
ncbi:histidine kinase [Flavobacterium sp.]|uniref:sensor histidine kinase n=1 Tax=Flavobacterium sp. TaxID=239 RepID=UPI003D0DA849